jgi:crossover junction endodeoxyribonuclease RuvC
MSKVFLGIDPGQTGCLAAIQFLDEGKIVRFFDPPLFQVKSGNKTKNEYNEVLMARALKEFAAMGTEVVCVLEKVSAMPDQGVTSMFNFGMGYGLWRGMLSAFEIPYSLVHPATWKKALMQDMPKEKDAARLRAVQLYPQAASELARKKDIGRADALLLAHYGVHFGLTCSDKTFVTT